MFPRIRTRRELLRIRISKTSGEGCSVITRYEYRYIVGSCCYSFQLNLSYILFRKAIEDGDIGEVKQVIVSFGRILEVPR